MLLAASDKVGAGRLPSFVAVRISEYGINAAAPLPKPEVLEVSFPTSADEGAIPQILSNVGLLTITVDNESYTYMAMSAQQRLFFLGKGDGIP